MHYDIIALSHFYYHRNSHSPRCRRRRNYCFFVEIFLKTVLRAGRFFALVWFADDTFERRDDRDEDDDIGDLVILFCRRVIARPVVLFFDDDERLRGAGTGDV